MNRTEFRSIRRSSTFVFCTGKEYRLPGSVNLSLSEETTEYDHLGQVTEVIQSDSLIHVIDVVARTSEVFALK